VKLIDRLVERHNLGSLAYFYSGSGNPANEDAVSAITLGRATGSPNVRRWPGHMAIAEGKAGNIPEIMDANPGRIFRNHYGVRADVTAAVGNVCNGRDTAMRQNQRQSVGRVARLSRNVRQPNHVRGNEIAGHKTERRPRAGEEWLAATKYNGVEVKSILINKTKVG
jgi:hypothetical protein